MKTFFELMKGIINDNHSNNNGHYKNMAVSKNDENENIDNMYTILPCYIDKILTT